MMFAGQELSNEQIGRCLDRMQDKPFSTRELANALVECEAVSGTSSMEFASRIMQRMRKAGYVENRQRVWYLTPAAFEAERKFV